MVDLLKEAAERFTELDVQLVYMVMKIAGFKLRGDSPSDLKDVILAIKAHADSDEWKFQCIELVTYRNNQRVQLMLETVYNIKNNRDNAELKQEKEKTNLIKNLISKTYGAPSSSLSITLTDIRNIETNGRWWVLGAQYKPTKTAAPSKEKKTSLSRLLAEADPKILKAAEKLHMNTPVRK